MAKRVLTDIRFPRGPKSRLPVLDYGEPAITEEGEFYVGGLNGNIHINKPGEGGGGGGEDTGLAQRVASLEIKAADIVNVKLFGAKGDGVTNDRKAIQDAIKFAEANNIPFVYAPAGVYVVYGYEAGYYDSSHPASLIFTKSVSFVGAGRKHTKFVFKNINGQVPSAVNHIGPLCGFIKYRCDRELDGVLVAGWSVDGGWRDINGDNFQVNHKFINFEGYTFDPKFFTFEDLDVVGFGGEGIHSSTMHKHALVQKCHFDYVNGSNGNLAGQVTYEKCVFANSNGAIETAVAPDNSNGYLKVLNCVFENATQHQSVIAVVNYYEKVMSDGTPNYVHDEELRGTSVEIRGNTFYGTDSEWMDRPYYGLVSVREIENVTFEGNTVYDFGAGYWHGTGAFYHLWQVNVLRVKDNTFVRMRRDDETFFLRYDEYQGKPGVDTVILEGNNFINTASLKREHVTEFFPSGVDMLPNRLIMKGNTNSVTYKDIALTESSVELAEIGSIVCRNQKVRVTYKATNTTAGNLVLWIRADGESDYDIVDNEIVPVVDGLSGTIEFIFDNPDKLTNTYRLRGRLDGGGAGGKVSVKIEILDLDYSAAL